MITILCPSRGRPHRLREMLDSVEDTVERPNGVEVIVGLDEDDPLKDEYYEAIDAARRPIAVWTHVGGPRPVYMSDVYNAMMAGPLFRGDVVCYCADDVQFGARGWDTYVQDAFKANPVLLLYDSGQDRDDCPIHGFVSKASCDALGFLFPTGYEHGYVDRWLWAVYRELRRNVWTPKVRMHHRHWHADRSGYDGTYEFRSVARDAEGRTCDDRDRIKFDSAETKAQIQWAVERLRRLKG